ncbi:hypothetical protein FB446DRAFT_795094 [Lentinula raphanica]|nr:hypothetical protein FB446DRAFT_795094 [Lentinula raphanica]
MTSESMLATCTTTLQSLSIASAPISTAPAPISTAPAPILTAPAPISTGITQSINANSSTSIPYHLVNNSQSTDDEGLNFDKETSSAGLPLPRSSPNPREHGGFFIESFSGAAAVVLAGRTALDEFNDDRFAEQRKTNLYYPFTSRKEWQLANWLLTSSLTMAEMDGFFKLEAATKNNPLSFRSAKELKARMDFLPPVARWKSKKMVVDPAYPTKKPLYLFYRDAIEVLQDIFKSPLVQDSLAFTPLRIFETAAKLNRVYDSWLSGERAWRLQAELPAGRTLIGTILSSDKTTISVMTGNRCAHPLLISIANIEHEHLSKASHHLLQLLALLPIPVYRHKSQEVRGVLENRLFHRCLDVVLRPLKLAAAIGVLMADPVGQVRICHTPCAAWILDTPEATLVSCVGGGGKTSPFTTAIYKDYGDPDSTGASLRRVEPTALLIRAGGTGLRASSDPSEFLQPEILHHWHKFFFDHDLKWCINVVGAEEIDFRLRVEIKGRFNATLSQSLPVLPRTGSSWLSARSAILDARDKLLDSVIPQRSAFSEPSTSSMKSRTRSSSSALDLTRKMNLWIIGRFRNSSVLPSIKSSGPIIQWDANKTERAHITLVKLPARSGNGREYEVQICWELDLHSRMRQFDLMTSMNDANVDFRTINDDNDLDEEASVPPKPMASPATASTTSELQQRVLPVSEKLWGSTRPKKDFFSLAADLRNNPNAPKPLRALLANKGHTAFHLIREPDLKTHSVHDAQALFQLPDFPAALFDYLARAKSGTSTFTIAGRRMVHGVATQFPFTLKTWSKVNIQGKQYHNLLRPNDTRTVFATSPDAGSDWKFGRTDCVLINTDDQKVWPQSSLEGHRAVVVKIIFAPAYPRDVIHRPRTDEFLAYCERFDVVNQPSPPPGYADLPCYQAWKPHFPDYFSGCYVLKKALRSNGQPFWDIIPVSQFRAQF